MRTHRKRSTWVQFFIPPEDEERFDLPPIDAYTAEDEDEEDP